jgi:hypothetical protein
MLDSVSDGNAPFAARSASLGDRVFSPASRIADCLREFSCLRSSASTEIGGNLLFELFSLAPRFRPR